MIVCPSAPLLERLPQFSWMKQAPGGLRWPPQSMVPCRLWASGRSTKHCMQADGPRRLKSNTRSFGPATWLGSFMAHQSKQS